MSDGWERTIYCFYHKHKLFFENSQILFFFFLFVILFLSTYGNWKNPLKDQSKMTLRNRKKKVFNLKLTHCEEIFFSKSKCIFKKLKKYLPISRGFFSILMHPLRICFFKLNIIHKIRPVRAYNIDIAKVNWNVAVDSSKTGYRLYIQRTNRARIKSALSPSASQIKFKSKRFGHKFIGWLQFPMQSFWLCVCVRETVEKYSETIAENYL